MPRSTTGDLPDLTQSRAGLLWCCLLLTIRSGRTPPHERAETKVAVRRAHSVVVAARSNTTAQGMHTKPAEGHGCDVIVAGIMSMGLYEEYQLLVSKVHFLKPWTSSCSCTDQPSLKPISRAEVWAGLC